MTEALRKRLLKGTASGERFRYVPASRTNVAATFARIKREQKSQPTSTKVTPIAARKAVK